MFDPYLLFFKYTVIWNSSFDSVRATEDDAVAQRVKPPPTMLASHMWDGSCLSASLVIQLSVIVPGKEEEDGLLHPQPRPKWSSRILGSAWLNPNGYSLLESEPVDERFSLPLFLSPNLIFQINK